MLPIFYSAFVICLGLVALFAASEAALAATNRVRLRQLLRTQTQLGHDENGDRSSPGSLSKEEQRFIATVTIAANLPLVAAAALCLWLIRESVLDGVQAALICAGIALIAVPLFQIAPRLLAAGGSSRGHLWWVRPARVLVTVLRPMVALFLGLGTLLLKPLGLLPSPVEKEDNGGGLENASEIRDLVESAQASGALEENRELIESIFTFGDTRVHEVMIPRPDIVALPLDSSLERAFDTLQESGLSRIPLYEESVDQIVGVLHAKDLLQAINAGDDLETLTLRDRMREALFLPEARKIDEALETMRARRSHLAIVIDEFGGTAGLLTVEDILEELVGEIADEHDVKTDEPLVILDDDSALADALFHVEDLQSEWNLTLPPGEFDTIGGFVIEQLGRAPLAGDRVETEGAILTVHAVRGRRPKTIHIQRKKVAPGEETSSDDVSGV